MSNGVEISDAIAQAERELRSSLALGPAGFDPGALGTQMTELGMDAPANAYVLAVSAIVTQSAISTAGAGGPVDATLQQLLDQLAADLVDGSLDSTAVAKLKTDAAQMDRYAVRDNIAEHFDLPWKQVPDIDRFFDTDGDGYFDADDTCRNVANPTQLPRPNAICSVKKVVVRDVFKGGDVDFIAVRDVDKDGRDDVVVANIGGAANEGLGVFGGKGTGRLEKPVWATPPVDFYLATATADFNEDGEPDVLNGNLGSLYLGGTGKTFLTPITITDLAANALATGDFNADGHVDVAAASGSGVTIFLGDGKGGLAPLPLVSTPYPVALSTGDFNGDGKLDLAAAHFEEMSVTLLTGDGKGALTVASTLTMPTKSSFATLADFDGDKHQDLVVALLDGRVRVLLGDGMGGFTLGPEHQVTANHYATLALVDVTRDGKPDVVVDYANDGVLHVLVNDGTAFGEDYVFQEEKSAGDVWGIAFGIGDLNGDGQPDIVYENGGGLTVLVLNL